MQKDANLVELEKCCRTHIFLQNFVLIQPRTSPVKFAALADRAKLPRPHPAGAVRPPFLLLEKIEWSAEVDNVLSR